MPSQYTLNYFACLLLLSLFTSPRSACAGPPADSTFKGWYFTPTGVFGRQPLNAPKTRHFVKITHPSPELAVVQHINPAGVITTTTRVYFRDGLIALSTETDRWGNTYDSTWFKSDGPGKFLVTERNHGVNPYLPCKYLQYTFKNDLLADIVCYVDSVRAGPNQDGVAHYVFERYSDPERRGLIKTESFFTEIDAPAFSRIADCHEVVNEYDIKGNLVSHSVYDQVGHPGMDRFGTFRTRYKYDGDDNQTEAGYYNSDDKVTLNSLSHSVGYRDYRHGFLSEESYCIDINKPAVSSQLGSSVSFVDRKYDREGNETETTYFDTDHSPVNNATNVQKIENLYSPAGMLTQTNFISLSAKGGLNKIYMSVKYNRDDKGRVASQHYETNTGALVPDPGNGATLTKYSYDPWGRMHSSGCWQNDSTRMLCRLGYYESVIHYDDDGQLKERDFYDEHGAPSTGTIGYSKEVIRRNELGLPAEVSYFAGDKPAMVIPGNSTMSGFHRMEYHYDQLNRLRSVNFYDQVGHPVNVSLHSDRDRVLDAGEIDFDYNGGLLTGETLKDSAGNQLPLALDCAKGDCLALAAFETFNSNRMNISSTPPRTYHGSIRPDTLFGNQLGFVGHDSVLVFVAGNWAAQSDPGCAQYYRLAAVNKYYQLDGRVIDYYMDNDSIATEINYSDGTLDGPVYLYYPNGLIREKGYYRRNIRYGFWEYYYDNGQKERTIQYVDGQPLLVDCYTRNGDVLAKNGTGRFEGLIGPAHLQNYYEMTAKGNVVNGFPDGRWDLYTKYQSGPANTEYFSGGKFRRGINNTVMGSSTYHDHYLSNIEGLHQYERLDHYLLNPLCRASERAPFGSDLYPEIRKGFATILGTGKYQAYDGWIFLDVRVGPDGLVLDSYVRLHTPNDALQQNIGDMVSQLIYPPSLTKGGKGLGYEKLYIFLLGHNEFVIPEELLAAQRNPFR